MFKMVTCVAEEDDYHRTFLGAAHCILELFPVLPRSGKTPAVMPEPIEVCQVLSDILPAASDVFTEDYYRRQIYSVEVLFKVAELCSFDGIPVISHLNYSNDRMRSLTKRSCRKSGFLSSLESTQALPSPASSLAKIEDACKANYGSQQFTGRKFTGNLTQSVAFLICNYEACAHQHRLSPGQNAEYFMNILEGPARTFFLN
eukprot:IDg2172t1